MLSLTRVFLIMIFTVISIFGVTKEKDLQNRNRVHSVRKVVDRVAPIEVKKVSKANTLKRMIEQGSVSGQVRVMYSRYNIQSLQTDNRYAGALGGKFKYELADYKGFNAGVAFVSSSDINMLTGGGENHNSELSSSTGDYSELSEAFVNYGYKGASIRVGRQEIDTPLADSDDIRMISNSFDAYVLRYRYNNLSFMAAELKRWQGIDAGLDTPWVKTGENGTYLGGIVYGNKLIDINVWYYNITKFTNAFYADISIHNNLGEDLFLHTNMQYLKENEINNSGIKADIYGALVELVVEDISFSLAYNRAKREDGKSSFSGFGGGPLYTSMDKMILNDINFDREAKAVVGGLSYESGNITMLYAYGDFKGGEDSLSVKAHIVEQNIGFEYKKEGLSVASIYTKQEDKQNLVKSSYDWENFRVLVSYSF